MALVRRMGGFSFSNLHRCFRAIETNCENVKLVIAVFARQQPNMNYRWPNNNKSQTKLRERGRERENIDNPPYTAHKTEKNGKEINKLIDRITCSSVPLLTILYNCMAYMSIFRSLTFHQNHYYTRIEITYNLLYSFQYGRAMLRTI